MHTKVALPTRYLYLFQGSVAAIVFKNDASLSEFSFAAWTPPNARDFSSMLSNVKSPPKKPWQKLHLHKVKSRSALRPGVLAKTFIKACSRLRFDLRRHKLASVARLSQRLPGLRLTPIFPVNKFLITELLLHMLQPLFKEL